MRWPVTEFMLGWATGNDFRLERLLIHDNTVIRCGGCCDYDRKAPFSMKMFGSRRTARDIEFRDNVVEDIAAFGRWIDFQAEDGGLSLIHTAGTTIQGATFADQLLTPQANPANAAAMATQSTTTPAAIADSSASAGQNLLSNGDFADGLNGWELVGEGKIKLQSGELPTAVVFARRDAGVGIERDVTEILQKSGPGNYTYGAVVQAVDVALHMKVTLVVEDDRGLAQHPSPDLVCGSDGWTTSSRTQTLHWSNLQRATLKVESGYGDRDDFLVREIFLRP